MADESVAEQMPVATFSQVTQVRVPLDEAAYAFTVRDTSGRIPVVVIPSRPHRIRNEFVGLGILVLAIAIGEILFFRTARLLPWAIPLSLLLVALGVYRSFMVRIPEGVDGLLARGGRYIKTIGSGTQVVAPWYVISHLVTRREIPFDVPVVQAPTKDLVRASVDTLITFRITDAYKFVYSISADDFDEVLQAACQDGLRRLVRRISSIELIDLARQNLDEMRDTLNAGIASYGVTVSQITITFAQPPAEFMISLEARRLAAVQLEEQAERQALAQRRQADAEALLQQELAARIERERVALKLQEQQAEARKRVEELEAEADELRLSRLEARLEKYPLAAQYEWESAQLEVARALASNSRAVLQVGDAGEIARALVLSDLMRLAPEQGDDGNDAGDAAVSIATAPAEAEPQSPEEGSTPPRTSRTRKTTKS